MKKPQVLPDTTEWSDDDVNAEAGKIVDDFLAARQVIEEHRIKHAKQKPGSRKRSRPAHGGHPPTAPPPKTKNTRSNSINNNSNGKGKVAAPNADAGLQHGKQQRPLTANDASKNPTSLLSPSSLLSSSSSTSSSLLSSSNNSLSSSSLSSTNHCSLLSSSSPRPTTAIAANNQVHGSHESLRQYTSRIIADHNSMAKNSRKHPAYIDMSISNPQQRAEVEATKKMMEKSFEDMRKEPGANVKMPTDQGGIEDMNDFTNSKVAAPRLYLAERTFAGSNGGNDTVDYKVGQTTISGEQKTALTMKKSEKIGLKKIQYHEIVSLENQTYEAQKRVVDRFDKMNHTLHRIYGDVSTVTVRDALEMERGGLPFLFQYMRKIMTGDGGYVKSVRLRTMLSDMETGATCYLENAGYFEANLHCHPHEQLCGHIGGVPANEQIVINALSSLMSKFNPAEKRLLKRILPLMLSSWKPDILRNDNALTPTLIRQILKLCYGTHESLPGGGMWLDAFGGMVPMTKDEAKRLGKSDEIYNDKHFTMIQRKIAMKVIRLIIAYIEVKGGWLFLDANEAALEAEGGIDMVSFLEQLHDNEGGVGWEVIDRTCFGLVTLRMKTADDERMCLISVHCPPSAQGPAGQGTNIRYIFPSMNDASMSNRCLGHINDMLTDPTSETVQVPTMKKFYDEPLVENNIFAMLLFVFGSQNCHFNLPDASHLAKASMQPELLSREYNKEGQGSRLKSDDSTMISRNHRKRDQDRAKFGHKSRRTAAQQAKLDEKRDKQAASSALKSCSVNGCKKPYHTAGMCQPHYRASRSCSVNGCKKPYYTAGMCQPHYRASKMKLYDCSTENCPNKNKQEGEFCTTCTLNLKKQYAK